ncbi:hypothetical protein ACPB8Q_02260 [Methanocaldococcus indicus]|uniref:hypothetical protein n=1 Tax=Methanocaldococcus indicus TaxID=213231 RepID=UPI003C6CD064
MRGQIAIDAILAVLFLLLVSTVLSYTIIFNSKETTYSLLADRFSDIADTIDNYILLSYSQQKNITIVLKPVGTLTYSVYIKNYVIDVDSPIYIKIVPYEDGVKLENVNTSTIDVGNRVVIIHNSINISKPLKVKIY